LNLEQQVGALGFKKRQGEYNQIDRLDTLGTENIFFAAFFTVTLSVVSLGTIASNPMGKLHR